MVRKRLLVVCLPLIFAAACGSSSPAGPAGQPAPGIDAQSAAPPVAAANPVDLIRKAGGDPAGGTSVGSTDAQGNRFANGEIGPVDGGVREGIRVYVWTGTPWPQKPSDDSTWYITGPGFAADLTGVLGSNGSEFPVSAVVVAQRLGGVVVPRG